MTKFNLLAASFTQDGAYYFRTFFVILALLIPISYVLFVNTYEVYSNLSLLQFIYMIVLLIFVFGILRSFIVLNTSGFVAILFMQFFLKILWFYMVAPDIFHDFGIMWNQALNLTHNFNIVDFNNAYSSRAVPIYLPLNLISYNNHLLLVLVNASIIFIIYLFIYLFLKKIFSKKVAQASVLFAGLAPELYAASGIPSHDILGVLFVFIVFTLCFVLFKYNGNNFKGLLIRLLLSISIAFFLVLLHLQRLPLIFMIAFFVLFLFLIFLSYKKRNITDQRIKLGILFIILSISISFIFVKTNNMVGNNARNGALNKITYSHGYSTGSYAYYANNSKPLLRNVAPKTITRLADKLIISELSDNPLNRIEGAKSKIKRLFNFGQPEAYFYNWNKKGKRWDPNIYTYKQLSTIYRNVFLIAIFLGILIYIYKTEFIPDINVEIINHGVILFLSFFVLTLILVGQTNPRYTFPIYFVAPFLISHFFNVIKNEKQENHE